MKISFETRLILFFTIISLSIIILGIVSVRNDRLDLETNDLIIHSRKVFTASEKVLSHTQDIVVSGLRYMISPDSAFIRNYPSSKDSVIQNIAILKTLTKDNAIQQARIDTLSYIVDKGAIFFDSCISVRINLGFDASRHLIESRKGKFYVDKIRELIGLVRDQEDAVLIDKQKANDESIETFNLAFYALLICVFIFLVIVFFYIFDNFKKRVKAEQELRRTNHFLDAILENIPNMIFVKDAEELRFMRFNKAGEVLLGYSRKDLIGKNDYDFFPKEQADFFTGKDRDVLSKGNLLDIPEEPINTAGGELLLHTKKIPITDEDGKPLYLLGISEDITEEKKAAQQLKDLNEGFLRIFDLSPVAMAISNIDDAKITQVNESFEKLFLVSKEEAIGKSFGDLKIRKEEEREALLRNVQNAGGRLRGIEMKLRRSNGEMLNALVSVETIEMGNRKRLISAAMDISQRKKAEQQIFRLNAELKKNLEQLEMVNTELEAFTYSVSHDLRAPLRIISGYAEMVIEDSKGKLDEDAHNNLKVIKTNASMMGKLIDDLLNLSRLGRKELVVNVVNMNEIVEAVLKEQMTHHPSHLPEIRTDILLPASCDKNLMLQVWTNLISNAIKYSGNKEKPFIEIGSYNKDNEIIYYIKDNGVGFDMQYSDKLFGVFQRLHKMTEFEGTGVGLAVVKRIVTKHGGRVWAEAEVDKGATFYFSLPA